MATKAPTPKRATKPKLIAGRVRGDHSRGGRPLIQWLTRELLLAPNDLLDKWSRRRNTSHAMRTWSPDVAGAYNLWTYPVRNAAVRVDSPEDDDTREQRARARLLETDCRRGVGMRQVLQHFVEIPFPGFGVLELTGAFGLGDVAAGEDAIPGAVRIPRERIRFRPEGQALIQLDDGTWLDTTSAGHEWRFLTGTWGAPEGLNPYGQGIEELVFWAWHFLTFSKKFWATALERFGMPTLFVKITKGEWETQRDAWLEILNDLVAHAGVVYPGTDQGEEVTVHNDSPRSFPGYKEFAEHFQASIRFAILGDRMAPGESAGAPATSARVKVGDLTDLQFDLVGWTEASLTTQLLRPLSEMRFGRYYGHRLRLELGDPRDQAIRIQQTDAAQRYGLTLRKSEVFAAVGYTPPSPADAPDDLIELTPAPAAGFGQLGGGAGLPEVAGFAEAVTVGGVPLIGGAPERRRLAQMDALAAAAALEGAKELQRLREVLRERGRPFGARADSPPSTPVS